jgi:hypothetical protein
MAGFLRKKVKQEPQPKPAPNQPENAPSTPLFARFASTSQASQEPQRIVSSPMLLSSASRRDGANVMHSRGGKAVAGNPGRRDVETRGQRNQSYVAEKAQEKPRGIVMDPLPQLQARQQQPLAAQPRIRPVSRVPMMDKPLPSPEANHFNLDASASNSPGPRYPQSPPHTTVDPGDEPPLPLNKPLPQPTPIVSNPIPLPRKPSQRTDPTTVKHNRGFSISSPPNSPPANTPNFNPHSPPPPSSMPVRVVSTYPSQKSQPPIPPPHIFRPDRQTLTPQPSQPRQDLQPVENKPRADSGDRTTPPIDDIDFQRYNALLSVAFGDTPANGDAPSNTNTPSNKNAPSHTNAPSNTNARQSISGNARQSVHQAPGLPDNALSDFASFQVSIFFISLLLSFLGTWAVRV